MQAHTVQSFGGLKTKSLKLLEQLGAKLEAAVQELVDVYPELVAMPVPSRSRSRTRTLVTTSTSTKDKQQQQQRSAPRSFGPAIDAVAMLLDRIQRTLENTETIEDPVELEQVRCGCGYYVHMCVCRKF